MNTGPIHVHIDELVLSGFSPAHRHRIADAVQRELGGWLAARRESLAPGKPLRLDQLDAGEFSVTRGHAPEIGRRIAHAVGGALEGALTAPAQSAAKSRPS